MSERIFPRWLHRRGNGDKDSVIVGTEAEEAAVLAKWQALDAEREAANLLTPAVAPYQPDTEPPKHRGGWPKGKPRTPRPEVVN